jgi:hypothetical protein
VVALVLLVNQGEGDLIVGVDTPYRCVAPDWPCPAPLLQCHRHWRAPILAAKSLNQSLRLQPAGRTGSNPWASKKVGARLAASSHETPSMDRGRRGNFSMHAPVHARDGHFRHPWHT